MTCKCTQPYSQHLAETKLNLLTLNSAHNCSGFDHFVGRRGKRAVAHPEPKPSIRRTLTRYCTTIPRFSFSFGSVTLRKKSSKQRLRARVHSHHTQSRSTFPAPTGHGEKRLAHDACNVNQSSCDTRKQDINFCFRQNHGGS